MRLIAKLYRYRRSFSQSDETAGVQKQLKDEMSADLTAFKKKGLDRKTNHQDLMKVETEEIFVLSKAIQGKETLALKLEQKVLKPKKKPKRCQGRQGRRLWREKLQLIRGCCRTQEAARQEVEKKRTAETEVQCCGLQLCAKARGRNPRRDEEIPPLFATSQQYQKHYEHDAEELERSFETKAHSEKYMNVSDVNVTDEDGFSVP